MKMRFRKAASYHPAPLTLFFPGKEMCVCGGRGGGEAHRAQAGSPANPTWKAYRVPARGIYSRRCQKAVLHGRRNIRWQGMGWHNPAFFL